MSCCSKTKVFEKKNGKVLHEFNCSNCSGYITVKLDEDLNGAHCVVCPSCQHEHYRIIKDGAITEDRAPSSSKSYAIKIKPTMAAFSKTSWESRLANRKTKLDDEGGKHFLNDAWKKMTGKQKQTPPAKVEVEPVKKPEDMGPIMEEAMMVPAEKLSLDEKIEFYRSNKEDCIKRQKFDLAAKYREEERKLKDAKEKSMKLEEIANTERVKDIEKKFNEEMKKPPVGERCPVHGVIGCPTCNKSQPSPIQSDSKNEPLDQIIYFCQKNKEACVSIENFEWATQWRDLEREFKTRRGNDQRCAIK